MSKLDAYVIFSLSYLVVFAITMIVIFAVSGSEPSTLITCVFATFGGEVLSCALIKIFKLKEEPEKFE
jgi:hypothetical protein